MRDNKSIEGLRFLLFISIFLFHALGRGFPMGWFGVQFFLVITGYFYTKKLLQKRQEEIEVKRMAWKRATRLYPIYLAVVFAMTAAYIVRKHHLPGDFFSYFLFAQNFQWLFVPEDTSVPMSGHFWYLTLDFYLVLIWLFTFKYIPRRHIKTAVWILFLTGIAYRTICAYAVNSIGVSYTIPIGMMDLFAVGSLLGLYPWNKSRKTVPCVALLAGLMLLVVCIYATSLRYGVNLYEAYTCYSRPGNYANHPLTINIYLAMALLAYFCLWFCTVERKRYGLLSSGTLGKWGGGKL